MFSLQTKIAMAKALFTKRSPFYIQFYVSKNCHLNCRMCNIVESMDELTEMDPGHIDAMAKNLVTIGAGVVLLTGGEPFLQKNIAEIVRVFKRHKMDIRMQTAGLYAKRETINECFNHGAKDINISLDSLDEDLSDAINGRKGSWRQAIKTISHISRTLDPEGSICALGCVLSPFNLTHVESVLEFATAIGWWVSLVPIHITEEDAPLCFRGYDKQFRFTPDQMDEVDALLERLKKKKRQGMMLFDSDDYLSSISHFIRHGRPNWRHKDVCDTPDLYFAIMPDGQFAPCCDHRLKNPVYVYDPDFPKIYKSKEFRDEVREIARSCPGCNFGSFPEMTLSARSFSTIRERLLTQFKAGRKLRTPFTEDELFSLIETIKARHDGYAVSHADKVPREKKTV